MSLDGMLKAEKFSVYIAHCRINDEMLSDATSVLSAAFPDLSLIEYNPKKLKRTLEEEMNRYWAREETTSSLLKGLKSPKAVAIVSYTVLRWLPSEIVGSRAFALSDYPNSSQIIGQVIGYRKSNGDQSSLNDARIR